MKFKNRDDRGQLTLNIPNPNLGDKLRDDGMTRTLKERTKVNTEHLDAWRSSFNAKAEEILRSTGSVTAEEVVYHVGLPPGSPNAIGANMRSWASRNGLVRIAFDRSARASRHSGVVARWARKAGTAPHHI